MRGLSSPSQRPVALGLLLAANVLIAAAMPWVGFFLFSSLRFGQRSFYIGPGIWLGQMLWLACWFSLSQHSLRHRLVATLSALGVANLAIAYYPCLFTIFYRLYHGWYQSEIRWSEAWLEFMRNLSVSVAFLVGVYAILLPVRRMRGIELGFPRSADHDAGRIGQFRISEWMVWTVLAVAPLAIIRWLMRDDLFAPLLVFLIIVTVGMLLLGVPAFFASALRRYWPVGIAASLAYVLGVLWFYSSGADLLGISWGGAVVDLRVALYVVLPALTVIYANNLILQVLGIGLVIVPPPEMAWSRTKEGARG